MHIIFLHDTVVQITDIVAFAERACWLGSENLTVAQWLRDHLVIGLFLKTCHGSKSMIQSQVIISQPLCNYCVSERKAYSTMTITQDRKSVRRNCTHKLHVHNIRSLNQWVSSIKSPYWFTWQTQWSNGLVS